MGDYININVNIENMNFLWTLNERKQYLEENIVKIV